MSDGIDRELRELVDAPDLVIGDELELAPGRPGRPRSSRSSPTFEAAASSPPSSPPVDFDVDADRREEGLAEFTSRWWS